jgi:RNA polymerase sigma-70 factor, ECF subfamily
VFDTAELGLIQLFLTAPARGACPTSAEIAAWTLFHRAHTVVIRAVLRRIGLRSGEVDDLLQQVWIVLLKRLPTWRYDPATGTVSGYVGKIAGREARRYIQRRARRPSGVLTAELQAMLLDPGPGPLSQYEWTEQRERARSILTAGRSSLSEEDHQTLTLRFIDGKSVGEIAAGLSVSVECARKKLQRAVQTLRAHTAS